MAKRLTNEQIHARCEAYDDCYDSEDVIADAEFTVTDEELCVLCGSPMRDGFCTGDPDGCVMTPPQNAVPRPPCECPNMATCLACGIEWCPDCCGTSCPDCARNELIPVLCFNVDCRKDTGERIRAYDDHAGHLCEECYAKIREEVCWCCGQSFVVQTHRPMPDGPICKACYEWLTYER